MRRHWKDRAVKVRKGYNAKVRQTKVHEVGHDRPEPTVEEGLADYRELQDEAQDFWQDRLIWEEYEREQGRADRDEEK